MKAIIRLTESDLSTIVFESIHSLIDEGSGIEISPKNKGKFNSTKERTGKSTEELMHSKNKLTRKRAIFAHNARKWNNK